jgi:hypothetical protein
MDMQFAPTRPFDRRATERTSEMSTSSISSGVEALTTLLSIRVVS